MYLYNRINPGRWTSKAIALLPVLYCEAAWTAQATANVEQADGAFWNLVIAVFVCAVAASVAYLCYFAVRLWTGYWRALALAPFAVLALWLAVALLGKLSDLAPRALWAVEILFWAMATTIYLVILFTARRTFQKAEDARKEELHKETSD